MEELLPDSVVAVDTLDDEADHAPLFSEEQALVAKAVDKRRREFTGVRACARRAMEKLGVPSHPVLPGERGAPRWPEGLVGSMTHCDGYRAAALARESDLASLGIDAEPHAPLPGGVLCSVSLPAERERLRQLAAQQPGLHWDRILFSAKESIYKAWYSLSGEHLGFEDADIEVHAHSPEPPRGDFRAALLVPGPVGVGRRLEHVTGHWTVGHGLIATAVAIPSRPLPFPVAVQRTDSTTGFPRGSHP